MGTVGSFEAKTHFSALLERVVKGEKITITKHRVPVAQLIPAEQNRQQDVQEVIKDLREFRKRHTLEGLSVRELVDEGR